MAKEANFSVGTSANKWSPVAWWYMLGRRVRDEGGWERTVLLNLDGGCYVIYIYVCIHMPCYHPKAQELLNFKHWGSQSGILGAVESSNSRGRNFVWSCFHRRYVSSRSGASSCVRALERKQEVQAGQCPAQGHCDVRQPSQVWVWEQRPALATPAFHSASWFQKHLLQTLGTHACGSPLSCFDHQPGIEAEVANGPLEGPQPQTEPLSFFPVDKRNRGQY